MGMILTDLWQATPDWLTQVLQKQNILSQERVVGIEWGEPRRTNVSVVARFAVCYDRETDAPTRFFLKIPNADFLWGGREVDFYRRIVPDMRQRWDWGALPFLHCYDVAYDEDDGRSHILFPDISTTHFTLASAEPDRLVHQEQAVDALARLHAFWWEHPRLGQGVGDRLTASDIAGAIETTQGKLQDFARFMGARLATEQRIILKSVVSGWPRHRLERLLSGQGITLVHRDLHPLNLLYPHDPEQGRVKLIDWQSWRVDTGTDDLAYYIACHWSDDGRRQTERPLLQRYHRQLLTLGVTDYTWDDCWYDYRASVIRCLFFLITAWQPVQWERGWWWPKVERGLAAFTQLSCADLLTDRRLHEGHSGF